MSQQNHFEVVIIGGGVSGLTSAALFSRFGLRTCVLEMDARPGGYIAGFRRKDFRFDSAIHWLNQCGDSGLVTKAFEAIGKDYPKAKTQTNIRRFLGPDMDFLVTNDPDQLKKSLIEKFPEDRKGIIRFFKDAKRLCKSFDGYEKIIRTPLTMTAREKAARAFRMLKFAGPFIPHVRFSGEKGVRKGLNKYFKSEKLKQIFAAEPDLLSCLIPISWAYSQDFQTPPEGGSQSFAEWLVHVIQHFGNEVRFKSRVKEIHVDGNVATGVTYISKGEEHQLTADHIIAACDVETLYEKMLPKEVSPSKLVHKLRDAELYASAVTLSIGIDCLPESLGFGEEIIYVADPSLPREKLGDGDPKTSGMHVLAPSVRDQSLAPNGKGTLTIFIPGFIDQFNQWETTLGPDGQYIRGDEYKTLKNDIAQILIERLEKQMGVDISKHIEYLDIATPVTHHRYTGNRGGTMMGARPGKENMKAKIAHYKTPVENLLLSGHWAELGGGVPVAVKASLNTTLMVLQKTRPDAFKSFAQYVDGKISAEQLGFSDAVKHYPENWQQRPTPAQRREKKAQTDTKAIA